MSAPGLYRSSNETYCLWALTYCANCSASSSWARAASALAGAVERCWRILVWRGDGEKRGREGSSRSMARYTERVLAGTFVMLSWLDLSPYSPASSSSSFSLRLVCFFPSSTFWQVKLHLKRHWKKRSGLAMVLKQRHNRPFSLLFLFFRQNKKTATTRDARRDVVRRGSRGRRRGSRRSSAVLGP